MPRNYSHPWNKDRVVGSRKALTQAEVCKIRRSLKLDNLHDLCLFLTAIDTMLRASDLLQLRVSDVQHTNGLIKTNFPWRQKKTTNAVYPVLTHHSGEALKKWIDGSGKRAGDYLFTRKKSANGEPITIGFYRTLVKSWIEGIGLSAEYYSAHSLRRTKATFLYEQGVTVEIVGRLLGHKSPASTIRYLGIDEAQAQSAALRHDIFSTTNSAQKNPSEITLNPSELNQIADQIWRRLAARLPASLTEPSK